MKALRNSNSGFEDLFVYNADSKSEFITWDNLLEKPLKVLHCAISKEINES